MSKVIDLVRDCFRDAMRTDPQNIYSRGLQLRMALFLSRNGESIWLEHLRAAVEDSAPYSGISWDAVVITHINGVSHRLQPEKFAEELRKLNMEPKP